MRKVALVSALLIGPACATRAFVSDTSYPAPSTRDCNRIQTCDLGGSDDGTAALAFGIAGLSILAAVALFQIIGD
jgi:hypothetical protein